MTAKQPEPLRVEHAGWCIRPICTWRRLFIRRRLFTFGLELTFTPKSWTMSVAAGRRVLSLGVQWRGQDLAVMEEDTDELNADDLAEAEAGDE